jgi:uncharacterized protein (TIGR02145 family)
MKMQESKIGNQIWTTNNLNLSHFSNGDEILEAKSLEEWQEADEMKIPAWCHYENLLDFGIKYGKLYNWHAVNDNRKLAPKNYRIPTDKDFEILSNYLGGSEISGKFLKNHKEFNEEIDSAVNSIFFNALPGGARLWSFEFHGVNEYAFFWSSSEFNSYYSWHRVLIKNHSCFGRVNNGGKGFGLSVRCIKSE